MKPVSRGIDRIVVTFDDPNLVANAGLLLVATLVNRLGLEDLCNATIRLVGRTGGFQPGRKILTLVHAMVAGASHIDHADLLRAGSTAKVLPHRVMAPSTLGTFLPPPTRVDGHLDPRDLEADAGKQCLVVVNHHDDLGRWLVLQLHGADRCDEVVPTGLGVGADHDRDRSAGVRRGHGAGQGASVRRPRARLMA